MFSNIDYFKTVVKFYSIDRFQWSLYNISYKNTSISLYRTSFVIKNYPFNLKKYDVFFKCGYINFYDKSKKIPYGCMYISTY